MIAPPPPPPDAIAICERNRRSHGMTATGWTLTGLRRYRRTLFGFVVLWVEERRLVYRPASVRFGPLHLAVGTPASWVAETRWRRARRGDP